MSAALPLFHQPWRWDAAFGPKGWAAARVEVGGELVAYWPWQLSTRSAFTQLRQPRLFFYGGPWVNEALLPERTEARLSTAEKWTQQLLEQLPQADLYWISGLPQNPADWPLRLAGWQARLRYTHHLNLNTGSDSLWNNLKSETRTRIRKAEQRVTVTAEGSWEEFKQLNEAVYLRQGKAVPYSFELLDRLEAAQAKQGARWLRFGRTPQGEAVAALYLVKDAHTAYLHLEGQNDIGRETGAGSLLLWTAIRELQAAGLQTLDFEGSLLPGVARSYRGWGARPVPFYEWVKAPHPLLRLWAGWQLLKR
jgi:hypothetical protein